jgi:hypothetical protein
MRAKDIIPGVIGFSGMALWFWDNNQQVKAHEALSQLWLTAPGEPWSDEKKAEMARLNAIVERKWMKYLGEGAVVASLGLYLFNRRKK